MDKDELKTALKKTKKLEKQELLTKEELDGMDKEFRKEQKELDKALKTSKKR